MPAKVTVAVIGVGNMGKNHVRTYAQLDAVRLVAIADPHPALCQTVADEYTVRGYRDFEELLDQEHPDAVSICVPTALHYPVAKKCLERGVPVLLEKPIAATVQEAEELLDLARQRGVQFHIGHIERFNPAVRQVKEIITRGELGKIIACIARRVGGFPPQITDANVAVDLAIHDVDVINYLLGEQPRRVTSHHQRTHIEGRSDAVEFFLQYRNASAYVQANWITPVKIRRLTITGSEGYLEIDYITQRIEFYKSNYEKFKQTIGDFSDYILRFSEPEVVLITPPRQEPLQEEIRYFIECVQNNLPTDSQFAVDALKIVLASA